jgi:carbon storage regulator CsrA
LKGLSKNTGVISTNWKESDKLVLTRSYEQPIIIDGDIKVIVLGIDRRGTVKLGFDAPEDVVIMREELLEDHSPT